MTGVNDPDIPDMRLLPKEISGMATINNKTLNNWSAAGDFLTTTKAIAFIDLDVSQLDINNGFSFIAIKAATTANSNVSATLLRTQGRFIPINQKAGASAVV